MFYFDLTPLRVYFLSASLPASEVRLAELLSDCRRLMYVTVKWGIPKPPTSQKCTGDWNANFTNPISWKAGHRLYVWGLTGSTHPL